MIRNNYSTSDISINNDNLNAAVGGQKKDSTISKETVIKALAVGIITTVGVSVLLGHFGLGFPLGSFGSIGTGLAFGVPAGVLAYLASRRIDQESKKTDDIYCPKIEVDYDTDDVENSESKKNISYINCVCDCEGLSIDPFLPRAKEPPTELYNDSDLWDLAAEITKKNYKKDLKT